MVVVVCSILDGVNACRGAVFLLLQCFERRGNHNVEGCVFCTIALFVLLE